MKKKGGGGGVLRGGYKDEMKKDYSMETKPWEIRSARNASGLSVLTR